MVYLRLLKNFFFILNECRKNICLERSYPFNFVILLVFALPKAWYDNCNLHLEFIPFEKVTLSASNLHSWAWPNFFFSVCMIFLPNCLQFRNFTSFCFAWDKIWLWLTSTLNSFIPFEKKVTLSASNLYSWAWPNFFRFVWFSSLIG